MMAKRVSEAEWQSEALAVVEVSLVAKLQ